MQRNAMTNAWQTHGERTANAWQTHCERMANATPWRTHGERMANAWQTHGKRISNAWQTHGECMANAWQTRAPPCNYPARSTQRLNSRETNSGRAVAGGRSPQDPDVSPRPRPPPRSARAPPLRTLRLRRGLPGGVEARRGRRRPTRGTQRPPKQPPQWHGARPQA